MPTRAVLIGINAANSWQAGIAGQPVLYAYVTTNSTQHIAFVSLQNARNPHRVIGAAKRLSYSQDMPYGVVVELYLAEDLADGETVYLSLAQGGSHQLLPPQLIDDTK